MRKLLVNLLSEILELLLVDREIVSKIESGLDRVGKLLELI